MRKSFLVLVAILAVSLVSAIDTGVDIGPTVVPENFQPRVWSCDHYLDIGWMVTGRFNNSQEQSEARPWNYAFEGEMLVWDVLVLDMNGINTIDDIVVTLGPNHDHGNDIEAECELEYYLTADEVVNPECNAILDGEYLVTTGFDDVAGYYHCELIVESPECMQGGYYVTVEAIDSDIHTDSGILNQSEYWFFNPIIAIGVDGYIDFTGVRPGKVMYSNTLLVSNEAEQASGVLLDTFISGTDLYDPIHSYAKCPDTNKLELSNLRYYATHGAYSTGMDLGIDEVDNDRNTDIEGYTSIEYGDNFGPHLYNNAEIIQAGNLPDSPLYIANVLTPNDEIAITFKLTAPAPCSGDFNTGDLFFWAETI